jgi:magnesium transporter
MTIAAERLAVIAAVTLPITAVLGCRDERHRQRADPHRPADRALVIMLIMSGSLLIWAKRKGGW